MKSVVKDQPTAEDDGDRTASLITTDRILKMTSYLLHALIQVTETFTKDHESKFLECIYFAFPDFLLREVELDPEARIEAENGPLEDEFRMGYPEEEDLQLEEDLELEEEPEPQEELEPGDDPELFDEASLAAVVEEEKVISGEMDADDARAFVRMLDQLLSEAESGERPLNLKSLAAVHGLRCQLLTAQGEKSHEFQSPDEITFSRWLIEQVDGFTNGRGMARDLKNAFPDLFSAAEADRSADDLLLGELDRAVREALIVALNDVLDAPDLAHSESGAVIEAAVCLLS
jgi:hypothetical protein